MTSSSRYFYSNLNVFDDFQQVMDPGVYFQAPEDWSLIVSDVKGSTKAVAEGRYRDVNMLGAATIAAVVNTIKDIEIPFVFGGDGASLMVPNEDLPRALQALKKTQNLSQSYYGLVLRVGAVSMSALRAAGADIRVAKYQISPKNYLAQFSGGGVNKAEQLVKAGAPEALIIEPSLGDQDPDLNGLSCRWEPFRSKQGVMLTLLVVASEDSKNTLFPVEKQVINEIEAILGHKISEANPIGFERMKVLWPPSTIRLEVLALGARRYLSTYLSTVYKTLLTYLLFNFNLETQGLRGHEYMRRMQRNSDFRKYDDMLRMVIDCPKAKADEILSKLEARENQGAIHFGWQISSEAVLTCLVFAPFEGRHLHFVDGGEGGYTLAAQMLKSKILKKLSGEDSTAGTRD